MTALKRARKIQALSRQEEDHLRLVIDTIPTMAWSLLPDGAVNFANQPWLEYSGLSLEEALEESTRIVHPEDLPRAMAKWSVDMAAGEACEDEMRLRRADGEYRWFLIRTVPLPDEQGSIVKWYGTGTDIEDRKRAEEASRRSAAELQALSRRLVELQESERRQISLELHDRVGQNLTALNINLSILKSGIGPHASDALRSRLEDSAKLLEATAATIANVMSELHPPMLDDAGLFLALEWYAKQFAARTGIGVTVQSTRPQQRHAPDAEIALFRIAQEALNNVAKHARASRVEIVLAHSAEGYVMSVTDDGVGFRAGEQPAAGPRPGLGLVTMRERARAFGGQFEVQALAAGGTRLTVRVPADMG